MADLDLSEYRPGRAASARQGKVVDLDLRGLLIDDDPLTTDVDVVADVGDTIDLTAIGLNRVHEVWVRLDPDVIDLTDFQSPELADELPAALIRLIGS